MTEDIDSFAPALGTGMRRVERRADFDDAAVERLLARLEEFDAVLRRGAVESQFAWVARGRR
jgi:hypothetical protein